MINREIYEITSDKKHRINQVSYVDLFAGFLRAKATTAGSQRRQRKHKMGSIAPTYPSAGSDYHIRESPMGTRRTVKVAFMDMGAAGINFAHSIQQMPNIELTVYEKNSDIGGTWLENRYPGCACDIPSVCYQFSWQRKPDWSQYYAGSREIWGYFKHVAASNDLERFVKFKHQIVGAEWLESISKWRITIVRDNDPTTAFDDYADFFLNGGGHLNAWKWPEIKGLDDFQGPRVHSANWDEPTGTRRRKLMESVSSLSVQAGRPCRLCPRSCPRSTICTSSLAPQRGSQRALHQSTLGQVAQTSITLMLLNRPSNRTQSCTSGTARPLNPSSASDSAWWSTTPLKL